MSVTITPVSPQSPASHTNGRKVNAHSCDHFVRFYENDETLVNSVSEYISQGLREGESSIVIATKPHVRDIENRLTLEGVDLPAARRRGIYFPLDASDTLSRFMKADSPNPTAFRSVIGDVLDRAGAGGRVVRAFGEMVSILWSQGNGSAAFRVEELWNELAKTHKFQLYCGYPIAGFNNKSHDVQFADICAAHSRVIPCESFSALVTDEDQLKEIAVLQQKASALEAEVAQRHEIEKVLVRRERELSEFLENAVECIHAVGQDGTIIWANQAELLLLGYSQDEYFGRHISDFHADATVVEDMLFKLLHGETLKDFPARLRCKNGQIKHALVNSNAFFEDGEFLYTRCFTHDVTQLYESAVMQHRLAAIVDSSDDAIISKTLDGIITSWNAGAERIFGFTAEEVIGKPKTIVFPPDRYSEEDEILSKLRRGERIDHFESVRIRKDGVKLDVSLTISPIKDANGVIVGASTIARDITQTRQQQLELAQLNDRLKRSMTETHHRVKNNLQVVSAMLEMQMLEHKGRTEVPVEAFRRLQTHVRTLAVIHEVLTKSIKETEEAQRVSVKSVLDDLVPMLQQTAGNRPVTFDLEDIESTSKQCVSLALILNELVSNAIKHGKTETTVRLSAIGRAAVLTVCDDGPGFPEGFDPVVSANTGLELIEGLVRADLSGTVTYENHPKGGACVSVRFSLPEPE